MLLIDKILADLGDVAACKQIRPFDLRQLGYVLSDRKIVVGSSTTNRASHLIYEVLDSDTKRAASFCFLYSKSVQMGIVLKNPYDHYIHCNHADQDYKLKRKTQAG
ncbi:MAG: hypothetical protein EBU46_13680 [Nitrosomonadaceae bacterium]|nr:hypothetical protein [Nitrosomonadaceae bacterium]